MVTAGYKPSGKKSMHKEQLGLEMFLSVGTETVNSISDYTSVLPFCILIPCILCAVQQTEPSPCNLLTVKIIQMKNARKADLCEYLCSTPGASSCL